MQRWPVQILRQLVADQSGGEGAGVQGAAKLAPQVWNGADMILMAMGDQQRAEFDVMFFQGTEAGDRDPGVTTGRQLHGKAAIDGDPLTAGAVQVQVGTKHSGAAEGNEIRAGLVV